MALPGMRHAGLKLVSVVLASLLWVLVSGEQTVERVLRIPLEFTNLPPQLEIVGDPPTLVDVRLRGSSGTMSRTAAGELAAVLDVATARSGQRLFHLTSSDVRAPFGIEVVQVTPASVPLVFEASLSKTVPVSVMLEGDPAPGFVVGSVTVDPATVAVVGPATALTGLSEAITEPVLVSGASATVTEMVTIGVADPAVRMREARSARVTVAITAAPEEWTVDGVAVQVRSGAPAAQIVPGAVTVHLRGRRDSGSSEVPGVAAWVDVTGLSAGRHLLPVLVEPPPGIGLLRVDPAVVAVTIR